MAPTVRATHAPNENPAAATGSGPNRPCAHSTTAKPGYWAVWLGDQGKNPLLGVVGAVNPGQLAEGVRVLVLSPSDVRKMLGPLAPLLASHEALTPHSTTADFSHKAIERV